MKVVAQKPFDNSKVYEEKNYSIHYRINSHLTEKSIGTVVMIHGFCGSTFSWRNNIDSLTAKGFDVLRIDLPPFGYSEFQDSINQNELFPIVNRLLKKENTTKPIILMGHSMGGEWVCRYYAYFPEQISHLILVDPALGMSNGKSRKGAQLLNSKPVTKLSSFIANKFIFRYNSFSKFVASAYSKSPDPEAIFGYMEPLQKPYFVKHFFQWATLNEKVEKLDYKTIKIPVLLIWGSKDNWLSGSIASNASNVFPNLQLEYILGAGHCPMETHYHEFNDLVSTFLLKR